MSHPRHSLLVSPLLASALILCGACATAVPGRGEPEDLLPLSEGLWPRGALLIQPGTTDVKNKYLPAVTVFSDFPDHEGRQVLRLCSGVLLHPRLVITAGHCVCASRPPRPDEQPPRSPISWNNRLPLSRARALAGITLTAIMDKDAPCARGAKVTVMRYRGASADEPDQDVLGPEDTEIIVHPGFEILNGTRTGDAGTVWANADLAAVLLNRPVRFKMQPLELPTEEVAVGDEIVAVGYGTPATERDLRQRQHGANRVTRVIRLETGSVIFRTEERMPHEGGPGARAEPGDSGGPAVKRGAPRAFVGIMSIGANRPADGTPMSIFMSAHSHKGWILEMLRRVIRSKPPRAGTPGGGTRTP